MGRIWGVRTARFSCSEGRTSLYYDGLLFQFEVCECFRDIATVTIMIITAHLQLFRDFALYNCAQ